MLVLKSRMICKRGKFEIEHMTGYYREKVKKLKAEKNIC
jgi:hypothetical protein